MITKDTDTQQLDSGKEIKITVDTDVPIERIVAAVTSGGAIASEYTLTFDITTEEGNWIPAWEYTAPPDNGSTRIVTAVPRKMRVRVTNTASTSQELSLTVRRLTR